MSAIPHNRYIEWKVTGYTTYASDQDKDNKDKSNSSLTSLIVYANGIPDAITAFAKGYTTDVRVTKVEMV